MRIHLGKIFMIGSAALAIVAVPGFANSHHSLNGTWKFLPVHTDFAGEPVLQTGTITIYDREHNLYLSRSFSYDGATQTVNYNFTTDSRENVSIRQGKTFKSKAQWNDHVLTVTTVGDNVTERERYSLETDGTLMLVVERPGHPPLTLHFQQ